MTTLTDLSINDAIIDDWGPECFAVHPTENRSASSRIEQAGVIYEVRVLVQIIPIGRTQPSRPFGVDFSQPDTQVVSQRRRIQITG